MNSIFNLLKILLYPLLGWVCYEIARYNEARYEHFLERGDLTAKRITIPSIIIVSCLVGFYNMTYNVWLKGDLYTYLTYFKKGSIDTSAGLSMLIELVKSRGGSFDTLLFVIAFITMTLTLLAYRNAREAYPDAVKLLFLSFFFAETIQSNLKQAIACGLVFLAIQLFLNGKWIGYAALVVAAAFFHECALIGLALPLFCYETKGRNAFWIKSLMIMALLLCFPMLMTRINRFSQAYVPWLANEMQVYMNEDNSLIKDTTGFVVLKGIPYYLITVVGYRKRHRLSSAIVGYDQYLWISMICSAVNILTLYSYWMQRFRSLFYLPVFIFFSLICKHDDGVSSSRFLVNAILLLFLIRWLLMWYPIVLI